MNEIMSAHHNRPLGDWCCLKAASLVTAEKIFSEPEAQGPLVLVHNEIRKQPHCLASSPFQPFDEDRMIYYLLREPGNISVK